MSITPTLHRIFHHQLSYALLFLRTSRRPLHRAVPESSSDTAFAAYQYAAPLLSDLHAEITAVISTPQRHASLPDQLRMQPGIADVITVAKAAAQLRAAIFCAGVVIGTYRKRCSVPLPARESAVPSGLHHERSGRRDKFCAAVHPCLRRALLRLRIQKERVTDDEEEGNLSFP